MKISPFDTCWWSGLDIIEGQLDWLTISVECAPFRYMCNLSTVHTIARAFLSGMSDLHADICDNSLVILSGSALCGE